MHQDYCVIVNIKLKENLSKNVIRQTLPFGTKVGLLRNMFIKWGAAKRMLRLISGNTNKNKIQNEKIRLKIGV